MKIITISGPARGGKDYLGNLLNNALPNSKCYALADILKEYVCELFNISLEELNDFKNSDKPFTADGVTMRTILQRFGTEIFVNKVDKLYWVNKLKEKINKDNPDYAIITDIRFKHEITGISNNPITIYIKNNNVIKENKHQSERDLDNYNFNFTINNENHPNLMPFVNMICNLLNPNVKS